jgi:hypothetical protein
LGSPAALSDKFYRSGFCRAAHTFLTIGQI